jgi:hypothetical protein
VEESGSFLKKRTKKLLDACLRGRAGIAARKKRRVFASDRGRRVILR